MSEIMDRSLEFVEPDYARAVTDRFNRMLLDEIHGETSVHDVDGLKIGVSDPHDYPDLPDAPNLAEVLYDDADTAPLVRILPIGNGLREGAVNQRLQSQIIADITRRPVLTVASPSFGSDYGLGRRGRAQVAAGDFTPVSERILDGLDELTEEMLERADIVGASQGAAMAPNLGLVAMRDGRLQTDRITAIGMPQVLARSRLQLLNDFGQAGAAELQERMLDTGVPQLLAANGLSLQHGEKAPLGFLATSLAENLRHPLTAAAMTGGMGKPELTWQRDVPGALEHGIDLTLISEGRGAIMPAAAAAERVAELKAGYGEEAWSRLPGTLALYHFRDGDHTSADHVPSVAAVINGDFRPTV